MPVSSIDVVEVVREGLLKLLFQISSAPYSSAAYLYYKIKYADGTQSTQKSFSAKDIVTEGLKLAIIGTAEKDVQEIWIISSADYNTPIVRLYNSQGNTIFVAGESIDMVIVLDIQTGSGSTEEGNK